VQTLFKRIELVTNIAIIMVALLLATFLIKNLIVDRSASRRRLAATEQALKPGMKVSLPGFDWSMKDSHIVLVLQKGCHFCSESAPFYQQLVRGVAGRPDLQLVATLPQSTNEARQYLNEIKVPIAEVVQANLGSIKVRGTPTLLLVDKTGMITDIWSGKLPPEKESEVLNRLQMKL